MSDTNRYWHIYQSTKHYDKRGLSDKLNPLPRSGWVSVCATEFNIHSTFCPHKSFVLRMDLWTNCNLFQYTILTSFITETKCVYCAVQFQYFNIIYVQKVVLVTRLTAEAQVRSHSVRMRFVIDIVAMGLVSPSTSAFPCQHHSQRSIFTIYMLLSPDKRLQAGTFQIAMLFRKSRSVG